MQKIFIVEDEENIRELISYALKNSGFEIAAFSDGENVVEKVLKELPDLIVLDIMLPIKDGLQILKELKGNRKSEDIPVIMLTAKTTEIDKVKGLDLGADDYISKPFSVMELISRVKAVLRRTKSSDKISATNYSVGDLTINGAKRELTVKGKVVELTYKEFELLVLLVKNKEKVLSRDQIINAVWDYDYVGESRTVDMHIKTLRQKLGDCGNYIFTVRNVGYVIKDEKGEKAIAEKDI